MTQNLQHGTQQQYPQHPAYGQQQPHPAHTQQYTWGNHMQQPHAPAPRRPRSATTWQGVVLGSATVAMGLIAGVWYAFSVAVMPALARSGDRVYIEVMQNINDVIENPLFFASFFGALILTGVAAWQQRTTAAKWWVIGALIAYGLVFVLTSGANVPLNNALAAAGDPAKIKDPHAVRAAFENSWVFWNVVRGLLSTAALVLLAKALPRRHRSL
ncbi:anthrone oxygenase family protein [Streptomyces sp. NPDC001941]|uniref:anthrone oxygenase family protein n=1 Tax=Streptomyces sp. NPDC001941 TaxID=3154659 RepID=UPI003316952A